MVLSFNASLFLSELLRENKRMLDRSIREIERERQGLQAQEKKLITEIKKTAKEGQMVQN
jgi:charged multivesicular body protein 2A